VKEKVPRGASSSAKSWSEWDENAEARHKQIVSEIDVSYHKILIPTIMRLIGDVTGKKIIDVGCGSGYLTAKLAHHASYVLGVDPSRKMIEIANREYNQIPHLEFVNESIEDFSNTRSDNEFDVAVSNMSLITIPDLDETLRAISSLLLPEGIFALNITHPCFYNQYRKYQPAETFQYQIPQAQKGRLIISNDPEGLPSPTTHFHRPLQEYFRSLRDASFAIDELIEPFPDSSTEKLYQRPWTVPHFLSIKCVKI
jgi:2-polyprenyl-3-methyl-5-hydroxy-6-metoxy-1,4-benzoquinol methylase